MAAAAAVAASAAGDKFTLGDLFELDVKTRERALSMLKEHKDYAVLVAALHAKRSENVRARQSRERQRKKKEDAELVERTRLAALPLSERRDQRAAAEEDDPEPSRGRYGDMAATCDHEDWSKRYAYRNRVYGSDSI
jgi:hypothetical protein